MEAEKVVFCGTEAAERDRSQTTTQHGNNETWSLNGAEGYCKVEEPTKVSCYRPRSPFKDTANRVQLLV